MGTRQIIVAGLSLMLLVLSAPAMANPASVPDHVNAKSESPLKACSASVVEALGFIDVGKANVFMSDCSKLTVPFEPPVALRFAYDRKVPGKAFRKAANAMLERNLEDAEFQALKERIESFNSRYVDIADGDAYYMLRDGEGGLHLWLNDRMLASVQDPELAAAYFRIWFGDKPFSGELKENLLTPLSPSEQVADKQR
jgi:hypothetical protein